MKALALEHALEIDWEQSIDLPAKGELHIWNWDADCTPITPALLNTLDDMESKRHERLVTDQLKQRYAASHVGMRHVLASYLSVNASDLRFEIADHGKPALVDHSLEFNLSHSGSHVLLAVSQTVVGIDCEQQREVKSRDALVEKHFTSEEQAEYSSLEENEAQRYFFGGWARKEAIVKFTGLGLAASVRQLNANQAGRITLPIDWQTDYKSAAVMDLATDAPMAAAVAMEQEPTAVRLFRLKF